MSKSYHSTKESKKQPQMTHKEKKALKLERKRAAELAAPSIKVGQGSLKPASQS